METITIKRSDWTGRTETVLVNREAQTLTLMGYEFRLELREAYDEGRVYAIQSMDGSWSPDQSLGSVYAFGVGASAHGMGMTREAGDMFVAAAQLLCDLI